MSVEVYEPDNLVLQGSEGSLLGTNAVSKSYVDAHISSACQHWFHPPLLR
jgi:hypothetical protein